MFSAQKPVFGKSFFGNSSGSSPASVGPKAPTFGGFTMPKAVETAEKLGVSSSEASVSEKVVQLRKYYAEKKKNAMKQKFRASRFDEARENQEELDSRLENRTAGKSAMRQKFRASRFEEAKKSQEVLNSKWENRADETLGSNQFGLKRKADDISSIWSSKSAIKKPCRAPVGKIYESVVAPIVHEVIDLVSDSDEKETLEERELREEQYEIETFRKCLSEKSKIEEMKKNASIVEYHEWAEYRKAGDAKARIIEKNPILKENIDRKVQWDLEHKIAQSQAIRLYEHLGNIRKLMNEKRGIVEKFEERPLMENTSEEMKKKCRKVFEKETRRIRYVPPKKRTRIMRNLTLNKEDKIPVFCDLPMDESTKLDDVEIPTTLAFDYIVENDTSREDLPCFKKSLEKESGNPITCGCKPDKNGKMTKCSENPDCRCYQLNRKMMERQRMDIYRQEETEYSTFGKIFVRDLDHFYDTAAFSCSKSCACHGCCDNNVMYTLDEKVNSFEVYRADARGFGLRTTSFIPHGAPVLELTGEIFEHSSIVRNDLEEGAFSHLPKDDDFKEWLLENGGFTKEYAKQIEELYAYEWYIAPKVKGNHARFVKHGCQPNLAMTRVFQGGFMPHQCKAVLVSVEDIWPGTQLTFDHVPNYAEEQFEGKCLCGTIGCPNKEDTISTLLYAPWHMIYEFYLANHAQRREEWRVFIKERKNRDPRVLMVEEDAKRRKKAVFKENMVFDRKEREVFFSPSPTNFCPFGGEEEVFEDEE